ncbi:MAG: hypothetical protein E7554_02565 [Ruminococcaceae bacterium]|nr:hypothetical protein [Oscillospiraceae bacterium]
MNHNRINQALEGIDPEFIAESMAQPAADKKTARKPMRKLVVAAAAACLVLGLSVTAYALNISGIRDLLGRTTYELPSEADQYIVPHSQVIEGEYWTCRVTESLTAGNTIIVALNITCDEDYILNGCMDIPSAEEIAQGVGSFAYAEQQGRIPLFIGANINIGDVDLSGYASSLEEIVSDREMNILIQRDKLTIDPIHEIECLLDVRKIRLEDGAKVSDETDTTAFTILLSEAPVLGSAVYTAADGGTIPGLSFETVTINRTAVGNVVTLTAAVTDETEVGNIRMLRCGEMEEYFNFHSWTDDGRFFWQWTLAHIDASNCLTVSVYNDPEAPQIGEVVFSRG